MTILSKIIVTSYYLDGMNVKKKDTKGHGFGVKSISSESETTIFERVDYVSTPTREELIEQFGSTGTHSDMTLWPATWKKSRTKAGDYWEWVAKQIRLRRNSQLRFMKPEEVAEAYRPGYMQGRGAA